MKTKNIWAATLLHYFNNNMVLVYAGTAAIGNQTVAWSDVLIQTVLFGALFLPFLAAKEFRAQR